MGSEMCIRDSTYCTETTGLGLSRCLLGTTAASKNVYDCCLTVAGAVSCYLRQIDLLHSFLILCYIVSPYFLFASSLSRGCIRVRFLKLNFLTFQKNEYSASYDPLSYERAATAVHSLGFGPRMPPEFLRFYLKTRFPPQLHKL